MKYLKTYEGNNWSSDYKQMQDIQKKYDAIKYKLYGFLELNGKLSKLESYNIDYELRDNDIEVAIGSGINEWYEIIDIQEFMMYLKSPDDYRAYIASNKYNM